MIGVLILMGTPAVSGAEEQTASQKNLLWIAHERDAGQPKESKQQGRTVTGSYVDHRNRTYSTDTTGMSVDVPGGHASFNLAYENGVWTAGEARSGLDGRPFERGRLQFTKAGQKYGTPIITAIIKDGKYGYNLPPDMMRKVTEYDAYGTSKTIAANMWAIRSTCTTAKNSPMSSSPLTAGIAGKDKYGSWKQYDESGAWEASGNRFGTSLTAQYDADAGKVSGYADRNGTTVFALTYNEDGLLESVQDADNRQITYSYDSEGRLSGVLDVSGDETTYTYNEDGKIIKISTPDDEEVHVTYNVYGDVSSVLDVEGKGYTFTFDYDSQTKEYYAMVTSTSSGQITEYWYDEEGDTRRIDIDGETVQTITKDDNALIVTDEHGCKTRKEYDEWDNLTNVEYPDGSETTYTYEHTYQHLLEKVDRGVITEYTYNDDGNLTTLVEAKDTETERLTAYTCNDDGTRIKKQLTENAGTEMELVSEEDYDDDGHRTQLVEAAGTELERVTAYAYMDGKMTKMITYLDAETELETTLDYDDEGNLKTRIDPEGNATSYTYTDDGNLETVTTVQGTWTFDYDADGRLAQMTDPFNTTTEREYDDDGNLKAVKKNGETVAAYTYDADGHLTQRTDAAGNVYQFEYNADGQLVQQTDPENVQSQYAYDADGRLTTTIDGNGHEIRREYGADSSDCSSGSDTESGRLSAIVYPTFTKEFEYDEEGCVSVERYVLTDGETRTVSYSYDIWGHLHSTTGPDDQITTYGYDRMGRLISVTDPAGTTRFEYDNWDHLLALTDANDRRTEFAYDAFGRLTTETRPMGEEITYDYDDQGRLWKILDAKQQATEYGYDSQGRVASLAYHDGKTVTLSCDADGNLTGYEDSITSASYSYDALGRKLSETVNYGTFSKSFSCRYTANGLKQSFTAPDGIVYAYSYNDNNGFQEIRIPGWGPSRLPTISGTDPKPSCIPAAGKENTSTTV